MRSPILRVVRLFEPRWFPCSTTVASSGVDRRIYRRKTTGSSSTALLALENERVEVALPHDR